tara:strand:+ start:47 stop:292 length:246 start_codon:yes stop_codon:yes gene_type:complete
MVSENISPRLKLIAKRDFDIVSGKYRFANDGAKAIVNSAEAWDVLALTVIPGSGLKILDAKILNERSQSNFMKLLREGITN